MKTLMKTLKMLLVIVLVVGSVSAFAQSVDELGGNPPPITSENDPLRDHNTGTNTGDGHAGQNQQIEIAARNYFEAKAEYISCRCRGDKPGMARAAKRMLTHSNALAAFKKQQAARDKAQDARLDKHSELVWKHESQINGKGGISDRLAKNEKAVKTLNDEMDKASLAIGGIDKKFDGLTWWVLALTIIVLVGFSRRFWIHR